jgi:hypothetical protein
MFNLSESGRQRRFPQWLLQVLLASSVPVIASELLKGALGWSELRGSPFGSAGLQAVEAITIGLLGFGLGLWISAYFPEARKTGQLAWIPLVSLLALGIAWDLLTFRFDFGLIWTEYFFWSVPGREVGPFLIVLLTYPALSSSMYSLAVVIGRRRGASRLTHPPESWAAK